MLKSIEGNFDNPEVNELLTNILLNLKLPLQREVLTSWILLV